MSDGVAQRVDRGAVVTAARYVDAPQARKCARGPPAARRALRFAAMFRGSAGMPRAPCAHAPTKRETTVMVHGMGKAFWHFLLVMLYMTLRKNHEKKHRPNFAVFMTLMGTWRF